MAPSPRETTAILLAGGRSARFGSDKGRAEWRGRSLLEHAEANLPFGRAETILVIRADQDADYEGVLPGATLVHDDPDLPDGPLRGVISGLRACETPWAWIVACDQPLVRPEFLAALLRVADDRPVIPEWGGRLQPLTALYPSEYAEDLTQFAAAGEPSLIGALLRAGLLVFEENPCREFDPDGRSFLNVNTPEQLEEIEKLLKESS